MRGTHPPPFGPKPRPALNPHHPHTCPPPPPPPPIIPSAPRTISSPIGLCLHICCLLHPPSYHPSLPQPSRPSLTPDSTAHSTQQRRRPSRWERGPVSFRVAIRVKCVCARARARTAEECVYMSVCAAAAAARRPPLLPQPKAGAPIAAAAASYP